MKTPPFLIGAALLFWGWQTGYLLVAVIMAVVLEASHLVDIKWNLTPRDFHRISDLCAILIFGMMIYRYFGMSEPLRAGHASMARWIPMGFFPLILGQAYSTIQGVDMGALFYVARQREKKSNFQHRQTFDVSYPALLLILISTSAANVRTPAFFAGMFVLAAWVLWVNRPRRRQPLLWLALIALAGVLGLGLQHSLRSIHLWMEGEYVSWFASQRSERNPSVNTTAIGHIGRLKDSGQIVMRATAEQPLSGSMLLHEASYNFYISGTFRGRKYSTWMASPSEFSSLEPELDDISWRLSAETVAETAPTLELTKYLDNGAGVLALPGTAHMIRNLPVGSVEVNQLGAVRVDDGPTFVRYRADYGSPVRRQMPPIEPDLQVPDQERAAIREVVEQLGLSTQSPAKQIRTLSRFFEDNFAYSLHQNVTSERGTPLAIFLRSTRAGHCEFFASATALILRETGIPTRYATGFLLTEYSPREKAYIIRSRHAHAWTLAYVDSAWVPIDNTPSVWVESEQREAGLLEDVADVWQFVRFRFDNWRMTHEDQNYDLWLIIAAVLLSLILFIRIMSGRKRTIVSKKPLQSAAVSRPRADSPLDRIEAVLDQDGLGRTQAETYTIWAGRIRPTLPDTRLADNLLRLVDYHNKWRFHRYGLAASERTEFERLSERWLSDRLEIRQKQEMAD